MLDSKEKNGCVCYVFLMILVTVDALLEVGVVYRCHRAASSELSLNLPIFASRKSVGTTRRKNRQYLADSEHIRHIFC